MSKIGRISPQSNILQPRRRKRIIPKSDSEPDNCHIGCLVPNKPASFSDLSHPSSSSSLPPVDDSMIDISPAALRYANSISFPPIIVTGVPHFTPQSSSDIVQFLRSLVSMYPTLPDVSNISWRLNNQHQLLLFAPTRDVFSVLLTNQYPSTIGISSTQVIFPRRLPPQLSLLLLNVPDCLDDTYLLAEIQKQFQSVKSLHRIRTTNNTSTTTLVRLDFELAQECDRCLNAKFLSVANVRVPVKQYLGPPRIPQCQKCCRFGHFANRCTSTHKICGKCAQSILPGTIHQCGSLLCINCSTHPTHASRATHDAFDYRCPSMLNYKKILVCKLVEQGTISNHIYVPKELQRRLHQVREHLQPLNLLSSSPSISPRPNAWLHPNFTQPNPPTLTATPANLPASDLLQSPSPFLDFMQGIVKPFDDQLSNLSKQMTNLTVLSVIQEHKIDYVSSLVEKIVLPSFKLMTETIPTLISLVPDSSMPSLQREELRHKLQQTSIFLHTAQDQHKTFLNTMDHTRNLIIDATAMHMFARPSPIVSPSVDTASTFHTINQ